MIRRCLAVACLLLAAAILTPPAWAEVASLVADVNPGLPALSFFPLGAPTALGNKVLFFQSFELWASDGTATGTAPIHAFSNGCDGFGPQILGTAGRLAFLICNGLWSTDGTRAGTVQQIPKWPTQPILGVSALTPHALFALLCDTGSTCALWRSDGAPSGAVFVRDIPFPADFSSYPLVAAGDTAFFLLAGGHQLWKSDGTAGTGLLRSFADPVQNLTVSGSRLFFTQPSQLGPVALWTSDGTAAGTLSLASFLKAPSSFQSAGPTLDFVVAGPRGDELWASDGTPAGTRKAVDLGAAGTGASLHLGSYAKLGSSFLLAVDDGIHGPRLWKAGPAGPPAPLAGCPRDCPDVFGPLVPAGGRVVFQGARPRGPLERRDDGLWASDGTGAGTVFLTSSCLEGCSGSTSIALGPVSGQVYYAQEGGANGFTGTDVWKTDGTLAGTAKLLHLLAFPYQGGFHPVAAGGAVFFTADDGKDGTQLWKSDGTAAGTVSLTANGHRGLDSNPSSLFALGGDILFSACTGDTLSLWASGGTPATTRALPVDLGSCNSPFPVFPTTLAGRAYFFAPAGGRLALWSTGGTAASTAPLTPLSVSPLPQLSLFQGKLLFAAFDNLRHYSFWTADGTAAGTVRLLDLPARLFGLNLLTVLGERLYFVANASDNTGGNNLWVSDGTAAGTVELTDFDDSSYRDPIEPARLGGTVYFRLARGSEGMTELWKTDGTAAGTVPVPAPAVAGPFGLDLSELVEWGGALYFFGNVANSGNAGDPSTPPTRGLYRSDGTTAGTVLLRAVAPSFGFNRAETGFPTAAGGQLFFTADDGVHGSELWRTDGTAAGTVLVRDLFPGAGSSRPTALTAAGNLLLFTADDGVHGAELWQSDGTAAGTRLVQDIAPGVPGSVPQNLTVSGGKLFFSADDGIWGREPWVYPLDAGPACQASPTALCLSGGRFQVTARWQTADRSGAGQAVALSPDTGYFWFFDPANVEAVLKVLDGRALNDHFWTFYGALSNVDYELTVTDTQTGAARRYVNPHGTLASVADTSAFGPLGANAAALQSQGPAGVPTQARIGHGRSAALAGPCLPGGTRLCLAAGRFAVEATWRDFQGRTGVGTAVALTGDTGYFWFFDPANVETVLKVLDGRAVNGKFWVFYGALSSVEYTLTVTDTATGVVRTYHNPLGQLGSVADTGAF